MCRLRVQDTEKEGSRAARSRVYCGLLGIGINGKGVWIKDSGTQSSTWVELWRSFEEEARIGHVTLSLLQTSLAWGWISGTWGLVTRSTLMLGLQLLLASLGESLRTNIINQASPASNHKSKVPHSESQLALLCD